MKIHTENKDVTKTALLKAVDLFTNIGKEGFFTKLNGMIERNGSAGNWK